MGNAAMSALEKATVDGLLKVAARSGERIERQELVDLLWWCQRRGLLQGTGGLFDLGVWKTIGQELFEAIQTGTKGTKRLARTYRKVRLTIEQVHADAEVARALQTAVAFEQSDDTLSAEDAALLEQEAQDDERNRLSETDSSWEVVSSPVAAPAGKFDDLIPPWNPDEEAHLPPPLQPSRPAEPTAPPMTEPMDVHESQGPDLTTLLTAQENVMQKLLSEMKRIDGGAKKKDRQAAYEKAAKALKEGLENIERQLGQWEQAAPNGPPSYLKGLEQPQLCYTILQRAAQAGRPAEAISADFKRFYSPDQWLTQKEKEAIETIQQSGQIRNLAGVPLPDDAHHNIPADPSFDMAKRWKAVFTDAEMVGNLTLTPLISAPIVTTDRGPEWKAFDYSTINKLQTNILAYGIDNPLIKKQLVSFCKYHDLIPGDIRILMELLLGATSYTLFLAKWQERLEDKQLENLELPPGDPLRAAGLDQLMGSGPYRDPRRQAALHPRVLAQSKAAALEAFLQLPQVGKPAQPYLRIQQKDEEPFLSFVDKVQEAVEAAPNVPADMKDIMTKEIVTQNANSTCRKLIATLALGATLTQMVEVCSRAPLEREAQKARIHAQALAAALRTAPTQGKGDRGPRTAMGGCFVCGQKGHFKKQCPMNKQQQNAKKEQATTVCQRCDKFGHKAAECRSRFKKDGTPLPATGNMRGRGSSAAHKYSTSNPFCSTAASVSSPPP